MFLLIMIIFVSILVALFAVQNAITVPLNFIFWNFYTSLVIVIMGAFLSGVLVATCFLLFVKARHYLQDKKMREEMTALQQENNKLQNRIAVLQTETRTAVDTVQTETTESAKGIIK